jgi:hypothetical protein
MKEKNNIYQNVPGQGKYLEDGTWWTNCNAKVKEIVKHYMIPGNYTQVCEVIETSTFDGKPFAK